MAVLQHIQQMIKKCDLFSTSQFLRYNDDQDYKTSSGGVCSMIVLIVFIVLFMNTALDTINMNNISWYSSTENTFDPIQSTLQISTSSPNTFMFAVGILGVNLNDPNHRYFDVSIIDHSIKRGNVQVSNNKIDMVPCTIDHFSINPEIKQSYNTLPTYRWLCPPLGFQFQLHGKYTSESMKFLQINIKQCNDTLNPSRPCVSNSTIANLQSMLGQFTASFFYINPLVNPGSKNYLSYYLEDRNYISFTRKLGVYSNGFIQDYEIDTDVSLLPFSQVVIDQGVIISQLFQNIVYQVTDSNYASFYLLKSSKYTTYFRSFTKADSFFSYVGGLVGTILGLMIIVSKYSQFSFELDISQKIFYYKQKQVNNFQNVNIFHYGLYLLYGILRKMKLGWDWKEMKRIYECRRQMQKQLNIQFILKRLNWMENYIQLLSKNDWPAKIQKIQFETLESIKKKRKSYSTKENMMTTQSDRSSNQDPPNHSSQSELKVNSKTNENVIAEVQPQIYRINNIDQNEVEVGRLSKRRKRLSSININRQVGESIVKQQINMAANQKIFNSYAGQQNNSIQQIIEIQQKSKQNDIQNNLHFEEYN